MACLADTKRSDTWAAQAAERLFRSGQHLQLAGKDVSEPAAMRPLLVPAVERFRQPQRPLFKRLPVV